MIDAPSNNSTPFCLQFFCLNIYAREVNIATSFILILVILGTKRHSTRFEKRLTAPELRRIPRRLEIHHLSVQVQCLLFHRSGDFRRSHHKVYLYRQWILSLSSPSEAKNLYRLFQLWLTSNKQHVSSLMTREECYVTQYLKQKIDAVADPYNEITDV